MDSDYETSPGTHYKAHPEPLDSVEIHNQPYDYAASIDASAPRGGKTSEEEGLANDPVKSDAAQAWGELIGLAETVQECADTLNRMEKDEAVDIFARTQLREVGKQKMLGLKAKKG